MTGMDGERTLAERFRRHAAVCSAPLYVELMRGMADDWEAGGPVRQICRGWEASSAAAAVQLRLLGGLHRVVLRGQAPDLAPFYPTVGGTAGPQGAWPVARGVICGRIEELRDALSLDPQTNEPGRAAALAVGLQDALWRSGSRRVRLLEVGASAGLNLLVDRYLVMGSGWSVGPDDARLVLQDAVVGDVVPAGYQVVRRRGCDLSPVDAATEEGRLRLASFVWPDHLDRFDRLQTALAVAGEQPVRIDPASAGSWLEAVLGEPVDDDVLTVVWHSVTRQYWPDGERARVEAALAEAGARLPSLAHVAMEKPGPEGPDGEPGGARLWVDVWVGGRPDGRRSLVGGVADHGVPVLLEEGVRVGP